MPPEDTEAYQFTRFVIPQTKCMDCHRHRHRVPGKTLCHECWQKLSDALAKQELSTPTQRTTVTRTRENFDRAIAAIKQAEAAAIADGTYRLPSRNQIANGLGLEDYFYSGTINGKRATTAYNEAQARLTLKRAEAEGQKAAIGHPPSSIPPAPQSPPTLLCPPPTLLSPSLTAQVASPAEAPHPSPPTPHPYQQKLEEDNARLRAEIEALRTEIKRVPTSSGTPDLLQALKDEDRRVRSEADSVLLQIDALQQQHDRLLTEADAIQRLIEQREATLERVEQTEAAFVAAIAETNGQRALAEVSR